MKGSLSSRTPRPRRQKTAGCPPRVLWDMTFAARSITGTRVYARKLFDALAHLPEWDLVQTPPADRAQAEQRGAPRGGARSLWWLALQLPACAEQAGAALIHAAAYLAPLRAPCPVIVNVLDTTFLAMPRDFDWKWRLYAHTLIPRSVQRAAAIITLSEHARHEIARSYQLTPERIHVVYPGVGAEFCPVHDPGTICARRAHYALPDDYLLFVGAQEPRKNVPVLIDALGQVRAHRPNLGLVLVGPPGRGTPALGRAVAASGLAHAVRDLGFVPQADLPALYAGACALVYASRLEGFGMPPLEAMACGTPVIAAPNPPLLEVLADGALLTASDSAAALASGILHVLESDTLAASLRARGFARAQHFTWSRAAERTATIYAAVLRSIENKPARGRIGK